MNIIGYIREAFESLFQNKLRSGLSLLGIIIGVSVVVILTAIGDGMKADVLKGFSNTSNVIRIQVGQLSDYGPGGGEWNDIYRDDSMTDSERQAKLKELRKGRDGTESLVREMIFTPEMRDILKKVFADSVVDVVPNYSPLDGYFLIDGESLYSNTIPVDANFFTSQKLEADRGVLFTQLSGKKAQNVAVIGANSVSHFKGKDPIGKSFFIGNHSFEIIGILPQIEGDSSYSINTNVFIPLESAEEHFGKRNINKFDVYVKNIEEMHAVERNLGYFLLRYIGADSPESAGFMLSTDESMIKQINKFIESIALAITAIASISLLVGGIGIMNIMLVSVTERTREIGIRKAIGARRRDIVMQFLVESSILSLIGGIGAILFSWAICTGIPFFFGKIHPLITTSTTILACVFSTIIGLVFGIFPAWKAAKMDAAEALRFE